MGRCLFLMPLLFRGGSEKQVRYIIDAITGQDLPLTVIVESRDAAVGELEETFVRQRQNVKFVFLDTDAVEAKYQAAFRKYFSKMKSLLRIRQAIREEERTEHFSGAMFTNLTGLLFVPMMKKQGCYTIFNERNGGSGITKHFFQRKLLKLCDKLVCNSNSAAQVMERRLHRDVEVINNGIAEGNVGERIPGECLEILVPARISRVKNQELVLRAIGKLEGSLKVNVTFAGVVEDENYHKELTCLCGEMGLQNVCFTGFISNMDAYYENSDLVILPSLEEGTPNVMLESFMNKKIMLASDIPMNAEHMTDKRFLFPLQREDKLAEKILEITRLTAEEKERVCSRNYDYVNRNFNLEKMGQRYIEILYHR